MEPLAPVIPTTTRTAHLLVKTGSVLNSEQKFDLGLAPAVKGRYNSSQEQLYSRGADS